MKELWRCENRFLAAFALCNLCLLNLSFCWSLNDEGVALLKLKQEIVSDPHGALSNWIDEIGVENPCSWSGVGCSKGYVVDLNLKDLCLRGTLSPHIGILIHLKSLILRNNSFSGVIPEEITYIKGLEVLDFGYNNFSGQLPCSLGNNFSMTLLLLDNNERISHISPEIYELQKLSEGQVEEELLSRSKEAACESLFTSWTSWEKRDAGERKLLQEPPIRKNQPFRFRLPPSSPREFQPPLIPDPDLAPAPAPAPTPLTPAPAPSVPQSPQPAPSPPSSLSAPSANNNSRSILPEAENRIRPAKRSTKNYTLVLVAAIGGSLLLLLVVLGVAVYQYGKVATVKPWATGLSGQLQRAFVTGVPKLKRSELEAACEDFSNVIGSASICTFYKGTLSSGVEIAVASVAMSSAKDWSSNLESQFRKKIDSLSKVNHKNFVSVLGFCEEQVPFTRMMVSEYAPNGTLFEHIHIKEAEHLDWTTRLRIAMGMAYCLEHMHQLTPPLAHKSLTSSSIYLTEDYAAKVSDIVFWDEGAATERQTDPQSNVYSFGVILFEMITGRLPYTAGSDSLEDWACDYLRGTQHLREMVDPTLGTYQEDQLQQIGELIRCCADERPSMKDVCTRLRVITEIGPDGAIPKLSPLWWAELEILSTEGS
ncbi:non-specific serine/threonine protein kinase [Salvia divinorum]|uniref:Non-specific serine/threonine protein kinase n=1 Tax=Salvia divinorum TaxID=28513 RepID=A0ABD1GKY9_SALDI